MSGTHGASLENEDNINPFEVMTFREIGDLDESQLTPEQKEQLREARERIGRVLKEALNDATRLSTAAMTLPVESLSLDILCGSTDPFDLMKAAQGDLLKGTSANFQDMLSQGELPEEGVRPILMEAGAVPALIEALQEALERPDADDMIDLGAAISRAIDG